MKLFKRINQDKNYKNRKLINREGEFTLYLNEEKIDDLIVLSNRSHHPTYKTLRNLKIPVYKNIYMFRNKQGFNTLGFIMNFDVIVTDKNGVVIKIFNDLEPSFVSKKIDNSAYIYFAVVGTVNFYKIKERDMLKVHKKRDNVSLMNYL